MARASGLRYVSCGTMAPMMFLASLALALDGTSLALDGTSLALDGASSGQTSCVHVSNVSWAPSCPCDGASKFEFTMEGETTVEANTVNLVVIIDSSGSVTDGVERDQSMAFAKNTVSAFADLNLFENGGTASFTQFSDVVSDGDTFTSQDDFNTFVDDTPRLRGGTNINIGVGRGRELLNAAPSGAASFMVVITDGRDTSDMVQNTT